jgi:hypothetical protein
MTFALDRIRWPRLGTGLFLTAVVALTVHVVMLQVLNVPFPDLSVLTPPIRLFIRTVQLLGLIVFWQFASKNMGRSFFKQWGALFLIASMLTETLFRGSFMDGYCTTAYRYAFASNIPKLLAMAFFCALIVVAVFWLRLTWQKVIAAAVIATLTTFAATPLIGAAMGPFLKSIADLAPQSEWCTLPYGANILIPAYLSFVEPVLACIAAAALCWDRLSPSFALRLTQFTLIVLAIKTQLLMPFIYASVAKEPFLHALASESQFALEALALAALTGVTWEWSVARRQ